MKQITISPSKNIWQVDKLFKFLVISMAKQRLNPRTLESFSITNKEAIDLIVVVFHQSA